MSLRHVPQVARTRGRVHRGVEGCASPDRIAWSQMVLVVGIRATWFLQRMRRNAVLGWGWARHDLDRCGHAGCADRSQDSGANPPRRQGRLLRRGRRHTGSSRVSGPSRRHRRSTSVVKDRKGLEPPIVAVRSTRPAPYVVGFYLVPEFPMMAFASAIEPLRAANRLRGEKRFDWRLYSRDGAPV